MERGNLDGDANGEVTSGWNHKDQITDATSGADDLVVVMKRSGGLSCCDL